MQLAVASVALLEIVIALTITYVKELLETSFDPLDTSFECTTVITILFHLRLILVKSTPPI